VRTASQWLLILLTLASVHLAEAQQPDKVPRIGYLSSTGDPKSPGRNVEAFRRELRDLGYVEGKNILVEYRYTGEMMDPRSLRGRKFLAHKPEASITEGSLMRKV
jgi:hypothetical protein